MASVVRREKSRFWTACFTSRDGRQLKRSTKTEDRNQALEIAIELERVERQASAGSLTTNQLRKVLSDVSEKLNGDALVAPTVEKYLAEWQNCIQARNSKATCERYDHVVRLFNSYLGAKAQRPITALTSADFDGFLNSRLNRGVAPKTATTDFKILKIAFRRAENYGLILKNPAAAVQLPKAESSERSVFTQDEIQKLLTAAPTTDWQTLILLGYFLGARLRDCVQMKWENVHPDKGVISYVQKKTGKCVVVPMHFHLIEHIAYLTKTATGDYLCPTLASKGPGGKHGLSETFKCVMKKANVDTQTVKGKGTRNFSKRTFHSLRHSFNSELANAGVAEEIRMKLTGHSSRQMNQRYTHLDIENLKRAIGNVPMFKTATAASGA
jgi:integrase